MTLASSPRESLQCCECGEFFDGEEFEELSYRPEDAFFYLVAFWWSGLPRVRLRHSSGSFIVAGKRGIPC
jgi:hypothetical protein